MAGLARVVFGVWVVWGLVGSAWGDEPAPPIRLGSSEAGMCRHLEAYNGRIYMSFDDIERGSELWVSDGTTHGTHIVQDLNPGPGSAMPKDVKGFADGLYFTAVEQGFGRELWHLTPDGAARVADMWPGNGSSMPQSLTWWRGMMFFSAEDEAGGRMLWRTNGTNLGTALVEHQRTRMTFEGEVLIPSEDGLIISRWIHTTTGSRLEIWRLDDVLGTPYRVARDMAGTVRAGRWLFSAANDTWGGELWGLDLDRHRGQLLSDLSTPGQSTQISEMKIWRGALFFWGTTSRGFDQHSEIALWRADGTLKLQKIKTLWEGPYDALNITTRWAVSGDEDALWFVGPESGHEGTRLWRTNGTPHGTQPLATIAHRLALADVLEVGDEICGWSEEWSASVKRDLRCVHKATGEVRTQTLSPDRGVKEVADQLVLNDQLYICARIGTEAGLWRVDRSGAQRLTPQVATLTINANFNLMLFAAKGLFSASDGHGDDQLWVSDGTPAGTIPLPLGLKAQTYSHGISIGNRVIFSAIDAQTGIEPWISDGTSPGTKLLKDTAPKETPGYPGDFLRVGDRVFFSSESDALGREPWVSDGTPHGTKLLKDIERGIGGSSPAGAAFWEEKQRVFFSAYTESMGRELWTTDATPAGTKLFKDLIPGDVSGDPYSFTPFGDRMLFTAYSYDQGQELWITDATTKGTRLLADIYPGYDSSSPAQLVVLGDKIVFSASDPTHGTELWVTDATTEGTKLIKDIIPGVGSSYPLCFFPFKGKLVFRAVGASSGYQLWITDGTAEGTVLFGGLPPRALHACPIAAVGDHLYLNTTTSELGSELWVTDGTAEGTRLVVDHCPGPCYSYFDILKLSNGLLVLFRSDESISDLWFLPAP